MYVYTSEMKLILIVPLILLLIGLSFCSMSTIIKKKEKIQAMSKRKYCTQHGSTMMKDEIMYCI